MIKVAYANVDDLNLSEAYELLPKSRKEKVDNFRFEKDKKLLRGQGPDDEVDPHREKEEIDKNSVLVELRIRKDIGDRIGNEDADDGRKGRNA